MAISVNLAANGLFAPPGGYPAVLTQAAEWVAIGVLPKGYVSVSATVKAAPGVTTGGGVAPIPNAPTTADVHLALCSAPSAPGGPDGPVVAQADLLGVGSTQQTLTVNVPSGPPQVYVVKLWADNFGGSSLITANGVSVLSMQAD